MSTNRSGSGLPDTENATLEDEISSGIANSNEGLEEEALIDSQLESDAEGDNLSVEEGPSNLTDAHHEA